MELAALNPLRGTSVEEALESVFVPSLGTNHHPVSQETGGLMLLMLAQPVTPWVTLGGPQSLGLNLFV